MKRVLLLTFALVLLAGYALADSVAVTLLRFGRGSWQGGYPYYIAINGVGILPAMCDDYAHGGSISNVWMANLTNLGSKDLSLVRFNNLPNALTLYEEAGWLLLQTRVTPVGQWQDMNYAVWHIFDVSSPIDSGSEAWLIMAQDEANKGFPGINFNLVEIVTPLDQHSQDPNGMQEFMYIVGGVTPCVLCDTAGTGVSDAPEPGTLLLLGSGLGLVFCRKLLTWRL